MTIKWNYESPTKKSNGYEDVMEKLQSYTKEMYTNANEDRKEEIIQEVFEIYRDKNIFPIIYFNSEGIREEIRKCIDKEVEFDGDILNLKFNQGSSLCRFYFPNMQDVVVKGVRNNSPYHKFFDDHKLKKAIYFCLEHKTIKKPVVPSAIKDGLEMLGGNVATNFKPMNAKALYEYYAPENGVIYDFAGGYGGRLLGALSSKNNYRYICVEPNMETADKLNRLGYEVALTRGTLGRHRIFTCGSEDFPAEIYGLEGQVDFAFSSPPYFNLEVYSEDESQCYNKFPNLDDWYEGYVRPTIRNIYSMLKHGGHFGVNMADFKKGKEMIHLCDKWREIAEEEGFTFEKQIHMNLQSRRGVGHDKNNKRSKKEGIFIFKKI